MINTVYKYTLYSIFGVNTVIEVALPLNAIVSKAGIQGDMIAFWAAVNKDEMQTPFRKFIVVYTGQDFEGDVKQVYNTFTDANGLVYTFLELL